MRVQVPPPAPRFALIQASFARCPNSKLRSFGKIIGIEERFLSPAVRAPWATSASAGQDASESLHLGDIQDRLEELSDERLARMDDDIKKFVHAYSPMRYAISRLGTTAALNQDRTAIYHNGLSGAESSLHQKQIGLRYVMSLTDSANRETLSHTFV